MALFEGYAEIYFLDTLNHRFNEIIWDQKWQKFRSFKIFWTEMTKIRFILNPYFLNFCNFRQL